MKKVILSIALVTVVSGAHAQTTAPTTSSMSCPAGYALNVGQPTPMPPDDPNQPPKSAAQKQLEDQQAMADQFSRWRCVPIATAAPQQVQTQGQ